MSSPTLIAPTSKSKPLAGFRRKSTTTTTTTTTTTSTSSNASTSIQQKGRREFVTLITGILSPALLFPVSQASAASDVEYVKETEEVINKIRSTINKDKNDPNVAAAVADLRETSNSWVAKYRREKALLGRASFRDIYSALNAVSGHYISFGPTAPIPAQAHGQDLRKNGFCREGPAQR